MSVIANNLKIIHQKIEQSLKDSHRKNDSVSLLAVSKTQSIEAILDAIDAGQYAFGENYEQEAIKKIVAIQKLLPNKTLSWHFIGPIQSNKTRSIAKYFQWVHSVDRKNIALRLSNQRPADLPPLNICIQVNISREDTKSGVLPEDLIPLATAICDLPHLKLRGLMAIPQPTNNKIVRQKAFHDMQELFNTLNNQGFALDTLSMGMSDDMGDAITQGSTLVRIGTAIFGPRIKK